MYVAGYQRSLRGPQALLSAQSDPRTDADTGTASWAGAADERRRGWAIEGGAGSLRLGAGLGAPHLCAGPAWQERSECRRLEPQVPPPPREGRRGCRGCRVPGPWTARWERTVAVSSARVITPSPGSSLSLLRPSPTPGVSRTRIRARPGPSLPTSALATPGGGFQPPRSNPRPWPRLHACTPWGPSARDRGLSFRNDFGPTRPSTCPFSQHNHPGRPEPHLLDLPSPDPDGLGSSVSGSDPLEIPGGPSLAHGG